MIIGAHSIIYSTKPEADRAFLRDVLQFPHVEVGDGWLIFGLPPSEVAVHPAEDNDVHELYLMCDDVAASVGAMRKHGIRCDEVQDQGWGRLTRLTLPGGGKLGVYQPRHARPQAADRSGAPRRAAGRPVRTARRTGARRRTARKTRKR